MPYFPKEEDASVTLKLKSGDTVTLIEKQLSVADRKANTKRLLSLQYDFKYKEKLGQDIDKRIEAAGLNRTAFDEVAQEGVELLEGVGDSLIALYASVLAMRFSSWDVFATKADFEASIPVEMKRDAIIVFAEALPQNFALLDEIMTLLKSHEEAVQKNGQPAPVVGGKSSTVKMVS